MQNSDAVRVAGEIDEQVAQQAVDDPRRGQAVLGRPLQLGERDLELEEPVVATLVHPGRLAGRPDEPAREQVRQRRVVLPHREQRRQQVGAPQHGAVGRRGPAEREVVAAARAAVQAVEPELLGGQAGEAGLLVQRGGGGHQVVPRRRRVDVHLDHAGVRGDHERLQRRVARQRIALDHDRGDGRRGAFDRRRAGRRRQRCR
jgi:hypothetical protein